MRSVLADLPPGARVAIAQPLPGIGDMVWHLPHLRAIRDALPERASVTLVTKRRSAADQLLDGEGLIDDVIWLDRGVGGFVRLTQDLRRGRFDAAVLLHHGKTLAAAVAAAGIAARYGYGVGLQRALLKPPFLSPDEARDSPHAQATAWLRAARIPLTHLEPRLNPPAAHRAAVRDALGLGGERFVAFGIGSSEPEKQWGATRFASLARLLSPSVIVPVGGKAEAALAMEIGAAANGVRVVPAIALPLGQAAALLAEADAYVGNDTGMMNLAAACGTISVGLFGATPPLKHSALIVPVVPPRGRSDAGMDAISPEAVHDAYLAAVVPSLPSGCAARQA